VSKNPQRCCSPFTLSRPACAGRESGGSADIQKNYNGGKAVNGTDFEYKKKKILKKYH